MTLLLRGAPEREAAALLVTDAAGHVLLVRGPGRRASWALPGGTVADAGTPWDTAVRETARSVGLTPRPGGLLVVDWPRTPRTPLPAAPYAPPQESAAARTGGALLVFDGGGISRSARHRVTSARPGSGEVAFVPVEQLDGRVGDRVRRVVEAALRTRRDGGPRYLEDGWEPAVLNTMRRHGIAPWVHSGSAWSWYDAPVPDELPIRQSWVWVFAPDGRVVMYVDDTGQAGLPGGTLEPFEQRDAAAASRREVREETQIEMRGLRYLGYLRDAPPDGPACARVRMAAAIARVGPAATDPATGTVHRRLLVPPRLAAELCGWGPSGAGQVEAALHAARGLGVAECAPAAPVEEIPADGDAAPGRRPGR
ncbi:NUDIX hydrolase [Streptomyces sp. RKND-216]|uniref:NUDIX hydrolase n=1 Tax=Streptomyces sp. RKND-216 TaxID=2562581 RepID=UPI00109E1109|nr:NUDIX hydrolase [Streptomyces sp. RKND-216]THA23914.1 NUDIX hydrolase [Streptomyces sp. RKND-216]